MRVVLNAAPCRSFIRNMYLVLGVKIRFKPVLPACLHSYTVINFLSGFHKACYGEVLAPCTSYQRTPPLSDKNKPCRSEVGYRKWRSRGPYLGLSWLADLRCSVSCRSNARDIYRSLVVGSICRLNLAATDSCVCCETVRLQVEFLRGCSDPLTWTSMKSKARCLMTRWWLSLCVLIVVFADS